MNTKIIKVDEADMKELETAHFEYNAYKDNINYMVEAHKDDPDFLKTPAFIAFREEFTQSFKRLDEIKAVISLKYIPKELILGNDYEWNADFDKKELKVTSNLL